MKMQIFIFLVMASFISTLASAQEYAGSSFYEVLDVIQDVGFQPRTPVESAEFNLYQSQQLPQYPVSTKSIFSNGSGPLERDAVRTMNQRFDYYDRLEKKLHPNGVCVSGFWEITSPTNYTGSFIQGSQNLFIGRISVAMEDTTSEDKRGFGFAGKVFPTLNPLEAVKTGNFFTVDVLMGTYLERVLDARTTNEPSTGFSFSLIGLGLKIASALKKGDENPGFRPLTQIAATAGEQNIRQPKWIRLSADTNARRNNEKDFRLEILKAMQENKVITYNIEVSDTTADRNAETGWNKIGHIRLNQAIVSYGCDRRLHFSHPKLK